MTVHIAATDFLFSEEAYQDLVVRLEFYDVLMGNLVDGSLYQTYYQFPNPTQPGVFESYTCTAQYRKERQQADQYAVFTYEGAQDFSIQDADSPVKTLQKGTWSDFNREDLLQD